MIPPRPASHLDPSVITAAIIVYGGMLMVMALALAAGIHVWRKL